MTDSPSWLGFPPGSAQSIALPSNSALIAGAAVNLVGVVANAGELTQSGSGGTFFTTGTVPAGTYLAGMTVGTAGTFISSDYVLLRIAQTSGASVTFPDQSMALVNNIAGSTGTILTNMVGVLVLSVATTIYYQVAATTSTSHTYTAEGLWYQKIA
jgi:hypothetical protein